VINSHRFIVDYIFLLLDLGMDEGEEEPVPLPNVNAAILKKVIQWCTYHKDDPPPPEDDENKEKRTDDICSWDTEFLKVDQGTLFELILVRSLLLHSYLFQVPFVFVVMQQCLNLLLKSVLTLEFCSRSAAHLLIIHYKV
jgi:hypothetical protein